MSPGKSRAKLKKKKGEGNEDETTKKNNTSSLSSDATASPAGADGAKSRCQFSRSS